MGTWGTGLYSDDLAADLRGDYRDLLGDGVSASVAVDRLMSEYAESLGDPDEEPVFWLALADISWKLGRLDERVRENALRIIDEGRDLARWESPRDRPKREVVLAKLRAQLLSPQPAAKRIPKTVKSANEWVVGEVIAFQLLSGRWVPLRVIGQHTDKGGRSAVCELVDWIGETIPSGADIGSLAIRRGTGLRGVSQFLFQEPRTAKDQKRLVRTGIRSTASQQPGGYTVFVWPHVDRLMREIFERE
jgi:hypothetical protein